MRLPSAEYDPRLFVPADTPAPPNDRHNANPASAIRASIEGGDSLQRNPPQPMSNFQRSLASFAALAPAASTRTGSHPRPDRTSSLQTTSANSLKRSKEESESESEPESESDSDSEFESSPEPPPKKPKKSKQDKGKGKENEPEPKKKSKKSKQSAEEAKGELINSVSSSRSRERRWRHASRRSYSYVSRLS